MLNITKQFQKRITDSIGKVLSSEQVSFFEEARKDLPRVEDQGIQAGIMRNTQAHVMDSDQARQFMTSNNFGPYLPELWPIITAWYPEFPLKELVSVQDMEQALAYIVTSELLVGTNKSNSFMGDKVETPTGLRTIKGRYPTGEIFGEVLEGDALLFDDPDTVTALAYFPILQDQESLASITVEVRNASAVLQKTLKAGTVSNGILTLLNGTTAEGSLELATGVLTLSAYNASAGTVTASYVWNIEHASDQNIPTVVEDMKIEQITAKPQVLSMKWTIFSEFVKKKQFGIDIRTQTTKRVLDLLYQYQVRYVLDRMWNGATGGTRTITWNTTTTIDMNSRVQDFKKQLNNVGLVIQTNTGRIEGNCLVIGNNAKALLESLPDTFYKPEPEKDYGFAGPRKLGKLGKFTVFYDNQLADDDGFMTYRGSEWYDAAAYYGVFLPIAPTDLININIDVRQAFVTMTAFRLDKPSAIVKLKFA